MKPTSLLFDTCRTKSSGAWQVGSCGPALLSRTLFRMRFSDGLRLKGYTVATVRDVALNGLRRDSVECRWLGAAAARCEATTPTARTPTMPSNNCAGCSIDCRHDFGKRWRCALSWASAMLKLRARWE